MAGGRGRRQRPSCSLPSLWAGRVCVPGEFGGGYPHPVAGALGRQLSSLSGQDGLPWRMARPSGQALVQTSSKSCWQGSSCSSSRGL